MAKGNSSYDFTPEQGEGVGRIYKVKCSGPHRAKGYLIRQDNLHWLPVRGRELAFGQRIGRSHKHELRCHKHSDK
jgi:hypothetical protein